MGDSAPWPNYLLAIGTIVAALFVAVQAWYARIAYVETSQTRFLERALDICFDNFDQAARLDAALRYDLPDMAVTEGWPPKIAVTQGADLERLQRAVIPHLDALEAGLTKASVLGPLDKFRAYLAQQSRGLSKRLLDIRPEGLSPQTEDTRAAFAALSDFFGAQYSVFTGCRLVAEGKA